MTTVNAAAQPVTAPPEPAQPVTAPPEPAQPVTAPENTVDAPDTDAQPDDAQPDDAQQATGQRGGGLRRRVSAMGAAISRWRGFITEPMSLREAWDLSEVVDARRIPDKSQMAAALWWWSNRTDRVMLFLALLVVPTWANGPVLWCARRPTRRWGLYLALFVLFVVVPAAAG